MSYSFTGDQRTKISSDSSKEMGKKPVFGRAVQHDINAKSRIIFPFGFFGALAKGTITYIVRPLSTSSRSDTFIQSSLNNRAEREAEKQK